MTHGLQPIEALLKESTLYGSGLLSPALYEGLPMPTRGGSIGAQIAFLYCHAELVEVGEGVAIWAPSYLCSIDAATARIDEVRRVAPADFGLDDSTEAPIGTVLSLGARQESEAHQKQRRDLALAIDGLLPAWLEREGPPAEHAAALAQVWPLLAEPALVPYYRALGGPFLRWSGLAV